MSGHQILFLLAGCEHTIKHVMKLRGYQTSEKSNGIAAHLIGEFGLSVERLDPFRESNGA